MRQDRGRAARVPSARATASARASSDSSSPNRMFEIRNAMDQASAARFAETEWPSTGIVQGGAKSKGLGFAEVVVRPLFLGGKLGNLDLGELLANVLGGLA